MRLDAVREPVGCLLIGESGDMRALKNVLTSQGVETVRAECSGRLLNSVQEGLCAARRSGGVCIAAEGEYWSAALALAEQLCVERVALIAPTDHRKKTKDSLEKQIDWMKGYARRNLFFCVSEVLVLEKETTYPEKWIDLLCRRMCNARVHRVSLKDQRWINCELFPFEAAARFLSDGDCMFSLAK